MKAVRTPYIDLNTNGVPVLYVREQPFLILGGELHNSASSSLEFMEAEVWPHLRQMHMNTVVMALAWECVEPRQGEFDFALIKGLIDQARKEDKKIVLLWFGLWKNGESFYVPSWVKEDCRTYFRACYAGGVPSDTISPFCEAAIEADRNAFCHLMECLKEYDQEQQTVIMVQVENEIGMLGAERDFSPKAQELYGQTVPDVMLQFCSEKIKREQSWYEAFGEDAPEVFMAYYYATAVEKIAVAGKSVYPLPMYVNAWLKQHPDRPGIYPSGGPVSSMIPVWKTLAPSLDMLAPDIYVPDLKKVCTEYSQYGNPLFIPEARRDPVTASNVFFAVGGMNVIGFSPFAIEDFLREDFVLLDEQQLAQLNIEEKAFNCQGTGKYLQRSYEVLAGMLPLLQQHRGTKKLTAFIQNHPNERGTLIPMQDYDFLIDYVPGITGSAGILLTDAGGCYIAGCNVKFQALPKKGSGQSLTIVRMEEGHFENGVWIRGRILNGDELHNQELGDMAEVKYIRICLHSV